MEEQSNLQTPKAKGFNSKLIIVSVAVVVVLAVGGYLLFKSDESQQNTETNSTAQSSNDEGIAANQEQNDNNTNNQQTDTKQPTSAKTVETNYTNSCFSPETVTINQGDSVKFINDSSKNMHPASNDHPEHTEYAGFDAGSPVSPGESYTFTFDKVGTWGFHDHLRETCEGTVVVQ